MQDDSEVYVAEMDTSQEEQFLNGLYQMGVLQFNDSPLSWFGYSPSYMLIYKFLTWGNSSIFDAGRNITPSALHAQ